MKSSEDEGTMDEEIVRPIAVKRAEKDARESLFSDIETALEPDWEQVEIPKWGDGRSFWIRGATVGERSMLFAKGFRQTPGTNGDQATVEQTPAYVPLLIAICLYWDNPASGKRERVFNPKDAKDLALVNRNRGAITDPLIKVATRLSGLAKESEEKAEESFFETETDGFAFDLLAISD